MSTIRSFKNVLANGKKSLSSTIRLTQEEYKEKYDKRVESALAEKVADNRVSKGSKVEITQRDIEFEKEKLQKKRKALYDAYMWRESHHVLDLKQHFGDNYFDYVKDTQYDCDEAIYQRRKEEEKREEEEEICYWEERQQEKEISRKAQEAEIEDKLLIESLNDTQRKEYEMQKYYQLNDYLESDGLEYFYVMDMTARKIKDDSQTRKELLKSWSEKQAKKPKHQVWNYSVELERRKV